MKSVSPLSRNLLSSGPLITATGKETKTRPVAGRADGNHRALQGKGSMLQPKRHYTAFCELKGTLELVRSMEGKLLGLKCPGLTFFLKFIYLPLKKSLALHLGSGGSHL